MRNTPATPLHASRWAIVAVTFVGACETQRITDSREPQSVPLPATVPSVSRVATCSLSKLAKSGRYHTKTRKFPLPPSNSPSEGQINLVYRGWNRTSPDPVSLALCDVPDNPSAIEAVLYQLNGGNPAKKGRFAGETPEFDDNGNIVTGRITSSTLAVFARQSSSAMITDYIYDGQAGECDPVWGCGCDVNSTQPGCEGYGTNGEYAQTENLVYVPPDDGDADGQFGPGAEQNELPPSGSLSTNALSLPCYGTVDNAHPSTHVPGTINVVGRTWCPYFYSPMMKVRVTLQVWKCFGIFCWWSGVSTNEVQTAGGPYPGASTNAAAPCRNGKWRGSSMHWALFPNGRVGFRRNSSPNSTWMWCF